MLFLRSLLSPLLLLLRLLPLLSPLLLLSPSPLLLLLVLVLLLLPEPLLLLLVLLLMMLLLVVFLGAGALLAIDSAFVASMAASEASLLGLKPKRRLRLSHVPACLADTQANACAALPTLHQTDHSALSLFVLVCRTGPMNFSAAAERWLLLH